MLEESAGAEIPERDAKLTELKASIQLVNFCPTQHLNKYINLKNQAEARMDGAGKSVN